MREKPFAGVFIEYITVLTYGFGNYLFGLIDSTANNGSFIWFSTHNFIIFNHCRHGGRGFFRGIKYRDTIVFIFFGILIVSIKK